MKKSVWSTIIKVIIAVATAIGGSTWHPILYSLIFNFNYHG